MAGGIKLADGRNAPFLWVANEVIDRLQAVAATERPMAGWLYTVLARLASDARDGTHDGFEATRSEIAETAGLSPKTLDKYVKVLESLGLLHVERRKAGSLNLPNVWRLSSGVGREMPHPGVRDARVGSPDDPRVGLSNDPPTEEEELQEELPSLRSGSSAPADDDDHLPDDLPEYLEPVAERVHKRLVKVAQRKQANQTPTLARVGQVVADFPEHDHVAIAGDIEDYWLHGGGARTRREDFVRVYRARCERVVARPTTGQRRSAVAVPPPDRFAKYGTTTITGDPTA